jgi:hypothetical protein
MASFTSASNTLEFTINSHSKNAGAEKSCFSIYITVSSNVSTSVIQQRSFAVVFGSHRIQACVALPTFNANEYSISVEVPPWNFAKQGTLRQQAHVHVYLIICDTHTNEDLGSLFVCQFTYVSTVNTATNSNSSSANILVDGGTYPSMASSSSMTFLPPPVHCSLGSRKQQDEVKSSSYAYSHRHSQSPISAQGSLTNLTTSAYMTGSSNLPQAGYYDTMLTPRTQQHQMIHYGYQPAISQQPVYYYSATTASGTKHQYDFNPNYYEQNNEQHDQSQEWTNQQVHAFQHTEQREWKTGTAEGGGIPLVEGSVGVSSSITGGNNLTVRNAGYGQCGTQYVPQSSLFRGFTIEEQPSNHPAPQLVRTTALSQAASSLGSNNVSAANGEENGEVPYPFKAGLEIIGDLDLMTQGWTMQEWQARRRLVQFRRVQSGPIITVQFLPLDPDKYNPSIPCISCIHWEERGESFVTSVDCIFLLEQLINTKFSVEEKNRIRRNLEGYHPLTVSKGKAESGSFFRLIMSFAPPKPRNIEKDVKVFPWRILSNAIQKIIGKYSADYSRTATQVSGPSLY